ncbi:MAG: helix-turn-helix transcriptional regulator [Hoeflea sp.]|uniref:helix-turn-helix transcriptional regulator n=1 Tax=Hoeflea sp. TaxID=1940281 RepID=UPI001DBF5296|nr:helix-turn-helix transcriptional regulator [Hoeflea sp.]MBU4530202.1 helix-turn-helix transcriptional regulator [Alphaproteobacteria bacterium]MBU4542513.1 helix-turn-helix transcriptional regulator [Alphaproteobacteria bacterium]MBU4551194.1 helix-turn-helix transcriptional regulator [Alphaproteobacteria bacterium]MBV1723017.1 helix-turn-helix transcriptional regulator [Hoeflea sp.]MBV1760028.1 helix-turn-helix transcriptional regulator [Hoeflea sp.]
MVAEAGFDHRTTLDLPESRGGFLRAGAGLFDGRMILTLIQLVCGTILAIDVGSEIHVNLVSDDPAERYGSLHLASEVFATVLLFVAFGLSSRYLLQHRAELRRAEQRASSLRSDFSGLVSHRFAEWGLSPAECEIALLTLKGLRIAEISRLRGTCEGTVKAHLSAIFRKSGVKSRPELLAKFVDDFLDFAAEEPLAPANASG